MPGSSHHSLENLAIVGGATARPYTIRTLFILQDYIINLFSLEDLVTIKEFLKVVS